MTQLEGQSVSLEKSLQTLIENHLDAFLGIRFLASEYSTGKTHGGRIDTLGIDESGCPCIIEHWGTGSLEITLKSMADPERAKPLLEKSYEVS